MTNPQFNYIYQRVRRHFRHSGMVTMSRKELKIFIGLLGVPQDADIEAHVFADRLIEEIQKSLDIIKQQALEPTELEQLINMEE